jgi:hypothetical protein
MLFFSNFMLNSPCVYESENCVEQKLQKGTKHMLYSHYSFYVRTVGFGVVKLFFTSRLVSTIINIILSNKHEDRRSSIFFSMVQ